MLKDLFLTKEAPINFSSIELSCKDVNETLQLPNEEIFAELLEKRKSVFSDEKANAKNHPLPNQRNAGEIDRNEQEKAIGFIQKLVRNLKHYEVINLFISGNEIRNILYLD